MDEDGSIKEIGSAAYPMDSPSPGWAETDPAAWWAATRTAVNQLQAAHRGAIEAIGLTGQMHGLVLTDGEGYALRPAILWPDERSTAEVERYRRLDARLLSSLANPPAAGMAGPTLLWLKWNEPRLYESARWALQPKDWLRMQLTDEALGDPTDASATLLYDFADDGWSHVVVHELGLRASLL